MATPVEEWFAGMDITAGRLESMNQRSAFQVTNYGADASGTVNANPGIQLALNAARDVGGAQVVVPPGVYLIGATLRIYNNTRLTLMAGAEFRRNVAGTMIINGDAGQSFGGYTGHSRIVIEGGLWNMRGTTSGLTASAMCISIGHATDIVIRDLEVRDVPGYHAVELNSTLHGVVENCRFRGFIDPGGRDFSGAVNIDLAKSVGVFGGFGPYDHTPCEDILVTGYFLVSRSAFRIMKQQQLGGSMVFVGSKNGLVASAGASAYCTAKAAEIHLARCIALEGAEHGIRVNVVNPDAVIRGSRIWDGKWKEERAASNKIDADDVEAFYRDRSMLKLSVLPEDIAEAVYFFASDKSGKSTGNVLNVDAGNAAAFTR